MKLEEIVTGLEETKPLYWVDSYARKFEASALTVQPDKGNRAYVVLDQTLFHPKSGGQPSDKGVLRSPNYEMNVKKAMLTRGVVVHWGKIVRGEAEPGAVEGEIDWSWRYLLMRRHTAGHLLDHCLAESTKKRVETSGSWLGDRCYVAYRGTVPSDEELKEAVDLENDLISRGAEVRTEIISYEELEKRAPDAPNIYRLPRLESVRVVSIEGYDPIPCGGTHLKDINEISFLSLKEKEQMNEEYKIYYDVEAL